MVVVPVNVTVGGVDSRQSLSGVPEAITFGYEVGVEPFVGLNNASFTS